jgi:transcriptional antiterminator NusG
VTGFLGDQKNPTPLSEAEIQNILAHMKEDTDKPKPKVMFDKGEDVRIIDGPFANFSGVIDEINADRGKLKVMVSIFGRATPVELEFVQVEKS